MQRLLVPTMLLAGVVLIGLGWQWNRLRPASAYWGEEQAAEYTAAQTELHSLSHEHGNGGDETQSPAAAAARERFAKISGQLEQARTSRSRTGTLFLAVGIVAVLSAVTLHFRRASSL